MEPVNEPGRWIVYMGKYPSAENVAKKKSELRQIGVAFEPRRQSRARAGPVARAALRRQAEANQLLERLGARGVRTARVLQERPDVKGHKLILPAVDDGVRARLDDLRTALGGRTLRPCR